MRRVLIIKLSSLGDVAQALPVASALRRRFPDARVTWAVEARFASLLHEHAGVDRVVAFPQLSWNGVGRGWTAAATAALREIRGERYDVALDLQGLFKSSVIAIGSRAPRRIGVAPQREGSAWVSAAAPLHGDRRHAVDRYLGAAEYLGAALEPVEFGLRPHAGARDSLLRTLRRHGLHGDGLIVVAPSPAQRWKAWPVDHWVRVIDALNEEGPVVLVGSHAQRGAHRELAGRARRRPVDLSGETSLAELVALLDGCALHVAPDTGTLHVAVALGRPVVGIYGPTPPWRTGPYGQLEAALHRDGECGATCPRVCLSGRHCLAAITADEVIARARAVLAGTSMPIQAGQSRG